jgi:hypothetical protein
LVIKQNKEAEISAYWTKTQVTLPAAYVYPATFPTFVTQNRALLSISVVRLQLRSDRIVTAVLVEVARTDWRFSVHELDWKRPVTVNPRSATRVVASTTDVTAW